MLIAQVVSVLAENSEGICDIEPSGGNHVHQDCEHQLVSGRIAGSFHRLSLVKLHCRWPGTLSVLI